MLSIGIITYKSRELLRSCLQSLQKYPASVPIEIIIIDNASNDGTVEMLKEEFFCQIKNSDQKEILLELETENICCKLISNKTNQGMAAAKNQAIYNSHGKFILLLDDDTQISAGALDSLIKFMENHPEVALAGPELINQDGSLQYSCRTFPTPFSIIMRGTVFGHFMPKNRILRKHLMMDWSHNEPCQVEWVMGAAQILRRDLFSKEIGFFDEKYFLYYEDVDLCFRLNLLGHKVFYVPEAKVFHRYKRRSARVPLTSMQWSHIRSILRFFWKRYSLNHKLRKIS